MPFTMIHLGVAHNLLDKLKIKEIPDYYLGSISPDAVHCRENFKREYKNISHLHSAHDDIELLMNDTKDFILKNNSHEYRDFYLGYGVHIITDLYCRPDSKDKIPVQNLKDLTIEDYFQDMSILDLELYKKYEYKAEIWKYFSKCRPIGIDGLVSAEEVMAWYNGVQESFDKNESKHTNPSKYILYDDVLNFMEEAAIKIYKDICSLI